MGRRSRKRGRRTRPAASAPTAQAPARRSRSEERDAAVRSTLEPYGPGERPWPIKVSALLALALGAVNFVLFLAGAKPRVGGQQPHLPEILIFTGLMAMCAVGMWLMRYWAVLGFQTLLAIGAVGFTLALIKVTSILWAGVCVVVVACCGLLFWKLVRVLSRIQMPKYPGR